MRLIDADELIKNYLNHCRTEFEIENCCMASENVLSIIQNAPTVETYTKDDMTREYLKGYNSCKDMNERPQGEWIKHIDNLYPEDSTEECPFCHEEQRLVGNDDNFCPNCGAKMQKGGAKNE